MSFLSGGQLSTDKLVLQFVHIFIIQFPVWAGINLDQLIFNNLIIQLINLIIYLFISLKQWRHYMIVVIS